MPLVLDASMALAWVFERQQAEDAARASQLLATCGEEPWWVPGLWQLEVANAQTRFTAGFGDRRTVTMTVGNGEGNYFADDATLDRLEGEGRVVFRYVDNPNGSMRDIAGISSVNGRVVGLMPHPEHATEALTGPSDDGLGIFYSALDAVLAA